MRNVILLYSPARQKSPNNLDIIKKYTFFQKKIKLKNYPYQLDKIFKSFYFTFDYLDSFCLQGIHGLIVTNVLQQNRSTKLVALNVIYFTNIC